MRAPAAGVAAGVAAALGLAVAACGEAEPLGVEVEVVTYPGQPMVVDLLVRAGTDLEGVNIEVEHADDPGVVAQALLAGGDDEPDQRRVRVRGLTPAVEHDLDVRVHGSDGREGEARVLVETAAALPGFVASFGVQAADAGAAEPVFRLFDLTDQPDTKTAGLFMVDPEGTTRWYLGQTLDVEGPSRIWAGAKLLDDGTVIFLVDNTFVQLDELGTELARVPASALDLAYLHHDVIQLPGGHFLAISNSFADVDYGGEGVLSVAGDLLVEFSAEGEVMWTWDTFDHLDPQRRREGFFDDFSIPHPDTGAATHDWTHANGVLYRAADDSLLLSLRHQDWLIAIDHGSGDVQWRLGDEGDFGLGVGTWFFHQHSPQWQADGDVLLYDNGIANPFVADEDERSRVVRYALDVEAMIATQVWRDLPNEFAAPVAGDADAMPDGHVLALDSSRFGLSASFDDFYSELREVDEAGETIWSLLTPVGRFAYRAMVTTRWVGQALAGPEDEESSG